MLERGARGDDEVAQPRVLERARVDDADLVRQGDLLCAAVVLDEYAVVHEQPVLVGVRRDEILVEGVFADIDDVFVGGRLDKFGDRRRIRERAARDDGDIKPVVLERDARDARVIARVAVERVAYREHIVLAAVAEAREPDVRAEIFHRSRVRHDRDLAGGIRRRERAVGYALEAVGEHEFRKIGVRERAARDILERFARKNHLAAVGLRKHQHLADDEVPVIPEVVIDAVERARLYAAELARRGVRPDVGEGHAPAERVRADIGEVGSRGEVEGGHRGIVLGGVRLYAGDGQPFILGGDINQRGARVFDPRDGVGAVDQLLEFEGVLEIILVYAARVGRPMRDERKRSRDRGAHIVGVLAVVDAVELVAAADERRKRRVEEHGERDGQRSRPILVEKDARVELGERPAVFDAGEGHPGEFAGRVEDGLGLDLAEPLQIGSCVICVEGTAGQRHARLEGALLPLRRDHGVRIDAVAREIERGAVLLDPAHQRVVVAAEHGIVPDLGDGAPLHDESGILFVRAEVAVRPDDVFGSLGDISHGVGGFFLAGIVRGERDGRSHRQRGKIVGSEVRVLTRDVEIGKVLRDAVSVDIGRGDPELPEERRAVGKHAVLLDVLDDRLVLAARDFVVHRDQVSRDRAVLEHDLRLAADAHPVHDESQRHGVFAGMIKVLERLGGEHVRGRGEPLAVPLGFGDRLAGEIALGLDLVHHLISDVGDREIRRERLRHLIGRIVDHKPHGRHDLGESLLLFPEQAAGAGLSLGIARHERGRGKRHKHKRDQKNKNPSSHIPLPLYTRTRERAHLYTSNIAYPRPPVNTQL